MTRFMEQVVKELEAMRSVGMKIPDMAIQLAKDEETMCDKHDMTVSECADLLLELTE